LLIEVAACAVCRTDLQIVEGDLEARVLPIVPGHQVVGSVASVGEGVDGWSVGDRAGVGWLASTCGTCRYCTSDRENLCATAEFTGWDRDGGYAGELTARADFALRLPGEGAEVDLAPLLCGGIIGYRALKVSGIEPGGRLGLFGFGASALLAIQVATHWDCEVLVVTRSGEERERALSCGAAWVGDYQTELPGRLDAAVTFAPVGDVVVAALEAVDRGGTVAINAIHLDRIPEFDYDLLWGERQLRSVANYTRSDAAEFLHLATTIPIETTTHEYAVEDANQALADVKAGTTAGTAVLVAG
jgi:propanol-preferring alcohol dehydrogenase